MSSSRRNTDVMVHRSVSSRKRRRERRAHRPRHGKGTAGRRRAAAAVLIRLTLQGEYGYQQRRRVVRAVHRAAQRRRPEGPQARLALHRQQGRTPKNGNKDPSSPLTQAANCEPPYPGLPVLRVQGERAAADVGEGLRTRRRQVPQGGRGRRQVLVPHLPQQERLLLPGGAGLRPQGRYAV